MTASLQDVKDRLAWLCWRKYRQAFAGLCYIVIDHTSIITLKTWVCTYKLCFMCCLSSFSCVFLGNHIWISNQTICPERAQLSYSKVRLSVWLCHSKHLGKIQYQSLTQLSHLNEQQQRQLTVSPLPQQSIFSFTYLHICLLAFCFLKWLSWHIIQHLKVGFKIKNHLLPELFLGMPATMDFDILFL